MTAILMRTSGGSLSVRKTSGSTELVRDEFNDRIRPDNCGGCSLSVFQRTTETWDIAVNRNHERTANPAELEDADNEHRTVTFSEKSTQFHPANASMVETCNMSLFLRNEPKLRWTTQNEELDGTTKTRQTPADLETPGRPR